MTATPATPNRQLKAAREARLLSQDDLARRIHTSKRQVQRWEAGTSLPSPASARALEMTLGQPMDALGFGATDPGQPAADLPARPVSPAPRPAPRGILTGIWLSRYEYYSSGRGQHLTGLHYVLLLQHDNRLAVNSLPHGSANPDSPLTMDLTVDGNVVTGTWREQTAVDGYYRGATYHGTIQLIVDPTCRRMTGKWLGFGSEGEINDGPWELVFQDASTSKATVAAYDRPPEMT